MAILLSLAYGSMRVTRSRLTMYDRWMRTKVRVQAGFNAGNGLLLQMFFPALANAT